MKVKDIISQNLVGRVFVCNPEIEKLESDPDVGMLFRLIEYRIFGQGTDDEHYRLICDFKEFEKHNIPLMKACYYNREGVPCERWIDQKWYSKEKYTWLYVMSDSDCFELVNEVGIRVNVYELQLNDGTRYRIECSTEELDKLIALIGEKNIVDVDEV
ncbi:MAG: hypothetical protein GX638_02180 [Crenarchaeota archaeon]|nr:hypothetical protein [Thermoproteota archaeon]